MENINMLNKLRIFLLRLLIGWWAVPILTVFTGLILYLLTGSKEEVKDFVKHLVQLLWNGEDPNS